MPDTQHGFDFEEQFAADLGLEMVPGSGNGWVSRLDLKGFAARWSLKATRARSFPLGVAEMEEAIEACEGPGGSGEMPMWAVRLMNDPEHDYVVMRKSDFLRFQKEELVFARESKADAKRRKASIPELMRDD